MSENIEKWTKPDMVTHVTSYSSDCEPCVCVMWGGAVGGAYGVGVAVTSNIINISLRAFSDIIVNSVRMRIRLWGIQKMNYSNNSKLIYL